MVSAVEPEVAYRLDIIVLLLVSNPQWALDGL